MRLPGVAGRLRRLEGYLPLTVAGRLRRLEGYLPLTVAACWGLVSGVDSCSCVARSLTVAACWGGLRVAVGDLGYGLTVLFSWLNMGWLSTEYLDSRFVCV